MFFKSDETIIAICDGCYDETKCTMGLVFTGNGIYLAHRCNICNRVHCGNNILENVERRLDLILSMIEREICS